MIFLTYFTIDFTQMSSTNVSVTVLSQGIISVSQFHPTGDKDCVVVVEMPTYI